MKEYEFSFKVNDLNPYKNYCSNNNYQLVEETRQTRTIYRNTNRTIARITIKEEKGNIKKEIDFKEDILSDEILIERRESLPLEFNDDKTIESILNFLGYKKDNTLKRTRIIYRKDNVTFELDDYQYPEKAYVVAIEGKKEEVDKVYNDIKLKIIEEKYGLE